MCNVNKNITGVRVIILIARWDHSDGGRNHGDCGETLFNWTMLYESQARKQ